MANKNTDRARQFLPFDALKGFKEAIREKERVVVEKIELSSEEKEQISQNLSSLKKGEIVRITYFSDHNYIEVHGTISSIDFTYQNIIIVKTKIVFDDILKIEEESR